MGRATINIRYKITVTRRVLSARLDREQLKSLVRKLLRPRHCLILDGVANTDQAVHVEFEATLVFQHDHSVPLASVRKSCSRPSEAGRPQSGLPAVGPEILSMASTVSCSARLASMQTTSAPRLKCRRLEADQCKACRFQRSTNVVVTPDPLSVAWIHLRDQCFVLVRQASVQRRCNVIVE